MDFITAIEDELGTEIKKKMLPLQPGDVPKTFAKLEDLIRDIDYKPETTIENGIKQFINWYKNYYNE